MKKIGIIGGSGFTGGELIRLVLNHPAVDLDFVYSTTRPGTLLSDTHADLLGQTDIRFTDTVNPSVDALFLCLGHGHSNAFLDKHSLSAETVVIDLSNEFRLQADASYQEKHFVYGLPEFQREQIEQAQYIANPGCFATAIQLALLPLAQNQMIQDSVHINAVTGSTGAGVGLSPTTHFSWRNQNASWYKPFTHQHLDEIGETLFSSQDSQELLFLPQRGNFTRGIFATAYTRFEGSLDHAQECYQDFYQGHPFTQLSQKEIHLKQIVNTNQCHLHLHQHKDYLMITSVLDNLLKGASGQAIQNLNLAMGWEETLGLHLKATHF